MLYADSATFWHHDGTAWHRAVAVGVHVQDARSKSYAQPGPHSSHVGNEQALKVWSRQAPPCEYGDYVAPGTVAFDEPPAGAARVESRIAFALHGTLHHYEVTAR